MFTSGRVEEDLQLAVLCEEWLNRVTADGKQGR
jgi:hypothetical protein